MIIIIESGKPEKACFPINAIRFKNCRIGVGEILRCLEIEIIFMMSFLFLKCMSLLLIMAHLRLSNIVDGRTSTQERKTDEPTIIKNSITS